MWRKKKPHQKIRRAQFLKKKHNRNKRKKATVENVETKTMESI